MGAGKINKFSRQNTESFEKNFRVKILALGGCPRASKDILLAYRAMLRCGVVCVAAVVLVGDIVLVSAHSDTHRGRPRLQPVSPHRWWERQQPRSSYKDLSHSQDWTIVKKISVLFSAFLFIFTKNFSPKFSSLSPESFNEQLFLFFFITTKFWNIFNWDPFNHTLNKPKF